jgi:hypothetical protein
MNTAQASATSTRALCISNWQDMVGIWMAGKLTQIDRSRFDPRLTEPHYLRGSLARRTVNQIIDYTGFFREETDNVKISRSFIGPVLSSSSAIH